MLSLTEPAQLAELTLDDLFHLPDESGRRVYRWNRAETEELKHWWGKIPRPECAERVSNILRQITGDPTACRTINAIAMRAGQLGLPAYNGDEGEICLSEAAAAAGIPYEHLFKDARDGYFETIRKGKQRYVTPLALSRYILDYRMRELAQAEVLEATQGEDLITKKKAMALAGLSETQITRYLKTGIIRAWKVPDLRDGERGDWAVDQKSVLTFIRARKEGTLTQALDINPEYVQLRKVVTRQVRELRQAGRLGKRDPLRDPKSRYHPGYFTVAQVASFLGVSTQSLYEAIGRGELEAVWTVAGGRKRYALSRSEAIRYGKALRTGGHPVVRWNIKRKREIHEQGLLMTDDLANRYGYSPSAVERWVIFGLKGAKLKARRYGRYLVFEPGDVEAFERATGRRPVDRGAGE